MAAAAVAVVEALVAVRAEPVVEWPTTQYSLKVAAMANPSFKRTGLRPAA